MKTSISNLAWTNINTATIIPKLRVAGIQGLEIAPTLIWPDFKKNQLPEVSEFSKTIRDEGLSVSGIQSLSFGRPELQLFDTSTWPAFREHLKKMFEVGGHLNASVAVFGSPKNRIKGDINGIEANNIAIDFFASIIPDLVDNNIVLTLEPNAKAYGTDFLTNYTEVVLLSEEIGSPWIVPQIDTGCMWMSGDDIEKSFLFYRPGHVHLSLPNLEIFPGAENFEPLLKVIELSDYSGWIVIEMLNRSGDEVENVISAAEALHNQIRSISTIE